MQITILHYIKICKNKIVSPQTRSSEANFSEQTWSLGKSKVEWVEKKYTAKILGLKSSVVMATKNADNLRDVPLYRLAGKHYIVVSVTPGKQC